MKLTIRNQTVRIALFTGFGIAIILLTIRHYYEATTFSNVSRGSQSVIQTIAVLNNTIELTIELGYPLHAQLPDPTAQAILRANQSARTKAAIRPLLDSLVTLTQDTPEFNPLARQLKAEADVVLQADIIRNSDNASQKIQQLVRMLRTFRLALSDNLLGSQKQISGHIAVMRTLNTIVDSVLLLLATALLIVFYRYTLRRERLTKQVIDRQKELTQYLEAIPEGVIVLNTDKQLVYTNQAAQQMLTILPTESNLYLSDLARRFRLAYADSREPFQPDDIPLSRALKGEIISTDNMLLETESGSRVITSQARPLYDREDQLIGAISIFRDITEANQKEQELQQARTIAEQSLQEREIFLANISHDIRTPLNAILGFTELLRQKRMAPDEQEYLNGIKLSGNNLLALINELLDISRIESGQLVLEPVPTATYELIQTIETHLSAKAGEKGLRYEVQIDPAVPPVLLADPLRLTQILLNIGANAVKFTKEGFIKLSVYPEPSSQPEQTTVVFCIEDSGVGMDDENQDHIFNRFSRVFSDDLFRSAGTGLGINIAQSLVSLMNGIIDVKSSLGQGTTFTIRIPFVIPQTVAPAPALAPPPLPVPPLDSTTSRSTIDVLVVEDNEMNQKVMEGFMMRYQLKPVIANNGLEAVAMLAHRTFDLILMDIQMPEMDGYTATQVIRQDLALTTPIIAMTAYTMPGERERCLATGMNAYLAKPVRMEQIDEILALFAPGFKLPAAASPDSHTANTEKELIDWAYLNEVTDGDNELLADLLSLFTRDLPQYRRALFEAIEAQDRTAFNQTAHKFRSSLNSLAMLSLAVRLKEMESEGQEFNLTLAARLAGLFQDINNCLRILEHKLESDIIT
ncbi:hybrid sensor histidine kinase/response regulator [Spirosoma luteum]|uniref:hybrid sensor histidine kinase/response regulator n=1 Tax=Spirosoma luteum TaxID=431553 RepID=UPI0003734D88|nr:response regulator [Spirosoma luteum]